MAEPQDARDLTLGPAIPSPPMPPPTPLPAPPMRHVASTLTTITAVDLTSRNTTAIDLALDKKDERLRPKASTQSFRASLRQRDLRFWLVFVAIVFSTFLSAIDTVRQVLLLHFVVQSNSYVLLDICIHRAPHYHPQLGRNEQSRGRRSATFMGRFFFCPRRDGRPPAQREARRGLRTPACPHGRAHRLRRGLRTVRRYTQRDRVDRRSRCASNCFGSVLLILTTSAMKWYKAWEAPRSKFCAPSSSRTSSRYATEDSSQASSARTYIRTPCHSSFSLTRRMMQNMEYRRRGRTVFRRRVLTGCRTGLALALLYVPVPLSEKKPETDHHWVFVRRHEPPAVRHCAGTGVYLPRPAHAARLERVGEAATYGLDVRLPSPFQLVAAVLTARALQRKLHPDRELDVVYDRAELGGRDIRMGRFPCPAPAVSWCRGFGSCIACRVEMGERADGECIASVALSIIVG